MDTEKLIKLLMMTTSNHDGEALNALRMANNILAKDKKTWRDIISSNPHKTIVDPISEMLSAIMKCEKRTPWEKEFTESIAQSYKKYGSLTDKQKATFEKIFYKYYAKAS